MPLNDFQRILADMEARSEVTLMVCRALLQRLALAQSNPHAFLADLFDVVSSLFDQIEETAVTNEYIQALRAATRNALDELAGSLARDSRLSGGTPQ